ncbi:hypothetical protein F4805DRAFT_419711 [Annulohypoxylon moriforme]|nr:hypothetical protein F4805DRAFT_419711 [Annulohypoxylon moriforme]
MSDSEPSEDDSPPTWSQLAEENRFYFTKNPRLKFTNVERVHFNGGQLTFTEYDKKDKVVRKMTIKYASTREGVNWLDNEILCLQHLSGNEHVVRTIAIKDARINLAGTGRDRSYPILALEYLPFGSLLQLRKRATDGRRLIPNRVLWRVFLCLARQQVGFLFPRRAGPKAPLWREVSSRDFGSGYSGVIEHNALENGNNHRFRDFSREDDEHGLLPAVVSTDFTRGRLSANLDDTMYFHLRAIGYFMTSLALNVIDEETIEFRGEMRPMTNWQVARLFPEQHIVPQEIESEIPDILWDADGIDHELKEVIARCLALDNLNMITYRNLLVLCEDGARHRDPTEILEMPPDREAELTLDGDKKFVRDFILNADLEADRSILGVQNRWGDMG